MPNLGKLLIFVGGMIMVVGAIVIVLGRLNLPLGRLPGDFTWRGKNSVFYFPLATCIIISVVLSLLMWLLRFLRR